MLKQGRRNGLLPRKWVWSCDSFYGRCADGWKNLRMQGVHFLVGYHRTFFSTKSESINVQDEPALKATFQVEITADKAMTVLSNMDVHSEKQLDHDKKTVLFNPTPKMSTYVNPLPPAFARKKD